MDPALWIGLVAAALSMLCAACVSALRNLSRNRFTDLLEQRGRAELAEPFIEQSDAITHTLATLRSILNLVVVLSIFHVLETMLADNVAPLNVYLTAFLVAGVIISVMIVAVPNSWGYHHRERLVVRVMPLLRILAMPPFKWIPAPMNVFDPFFRRLFGRDIAPDEDEVSNELLSAVESSEFGDRVDEAQKDMLEAVFDLPSTDAADVMTPRTDISGIDAGMSIRQVIEEVVNDGHSRFPVYEDSLDHILGVLYVKDLIPHVVAQVGNDFDWKSLLREPFFVPEARKAAELLKDFQSRKVQMALVLDEYGGTAGLVTIEDIVEELVGELQDEYEDEPEPDEITSCGDGSFIVLARAHVDDVADGLGISLSDGEDYDTIGGFVLTQFGHIPVAGETFDHLDWRFEILDAEPTRVLKMKIRPLTDEEIEAAKAEGDLDRATGEPASSDTSTDGAAQENSEPIEPDQASPPLDPRAA